MDELGKAFPASEGFIDAQEGTSHKPVNEFCLNCETKLLDKFCHHCGQKDIPKRQTMGELFVNFMSSFFSYEGKFLQTTKYIITKPGFLAVEFNKGKRESYYHPARMYVFISFIFFLLFFSLPDNDDDDKDTKSKTTKGLSKKDSLKIAQIPNAEEFLNNEKLDSVLSNIPMDSSDRAEVDSARKSLKNIKPKKGRNNWNWNFDDKKYKSVESYDSTQQTLPANKRDGWVKRKLVYKGIELNNRYGDDNARFGEDFVKLFKDNFSKVLFFLLPIFALILKLLYIRRDYYYSEHLVFSIYSYNFFFLAASIQILVGLIPGIGWLSTVVGFWIFFYLLFAMKKMYGQGWGKTIGKFLIFNATFGFFLIIGFSISAMAILLLI